MQYWASFHIGGQEIKGIFDTGSFELLTQSTRCTHCAHPTPAYDHTKSKTFKANGTMIQHVFGSGPCISMLGYDEVCVGDMCSPSQAFWEITDHRIPVLDNAKFAAIVGIGPQFGFGNQEKTLLMSYGIEEFSVCLQKESGSDGYLTWGPVASEETKKAHFTSVPVTAEHHWAGVMTDVYFGPRSAGPKKPEGQVVVCDKAHPCQALVDSGTSLIAAPTAALVALSAQIPPINEDCSNLHELPTLHLSMGDGKHFTLPPAAYVMRVTGGVMEANNIWDFLFFKPKIRKVNMCMPAFMQMDMESEQGPMWILGMPFFRYYHSSFNRVTREMHFATAGPNCEPLPYVANQTALLDTQKAEDFLPFDADISALVPPSLSSLLEKRKDGKPIRL